MKYRYEYRTSDNVQHDGIIVAASVNDAFATLKKQGIKPSRVVLAPGLLNRLQSIGKRWLVILVLSVICGVLAFALRDSRSALRTTQSEITSPLDRCQIYGDPALIQQCESMGWTNVFHSVGDCRLAAYAQPGRKVIEQYDMTVRWPQKVLDGFAKTLVEALANEIEIREDEPEEIRKVKRIVLGMREELRQYLADGGTAAGFCCELVDRQLAEAQIRKRMVAELNGMDRNTAAFTKAFQDDNADLRTMGIRPIVIGELEARK